MSKTRGLAHIEPVVWLIGVILIWEFLSTFFIPAYILPAPSVIFYQFFTYEAMWYHFSYTLYIVLVGFVLAVVGGLMLGILISHSAHLQRGLSPILSGFWATPKSAFAPLFIVWFGYGDMASIFVVFLMAFFPLLENTMAGMRATEPELIALMRSLRANQYQILEKVRIPKAMPYIFSGLKIAAPLTVIGAVVAEFISGYRGLGYIVLHAQTFVKIPLTFAAILAMLIIGLCLYGAIALVERRLLPWVRRSRSV